ncbi:MAG: helix-turn-helix transcriptional regulator [Clostridia bacterium]|nr:helix-turn-helix transcriptional regulator [Clostridia bacterium]
MVCAHKLSYTVAVGDGVAKRRDERYIGLNVYYIRKKVLHVSQEEFGYMVGMSKDTVSNIERGVYIPSVHNLVNIANCLDVSVDFFLYEIKEESLCITHTK